MKIAVTYGGLGDVFQHFGRNSSKLKRSDRAEERQSEPLVKSSVLMEPVMAHLPDYWQIVESMF